MARDCDRVRDRLTAGEPARAVEEHLAGCEPCRRFADRVAVLRRGLAVPATGAAGEGVTPDPGFSARVLERLPERRPTDLLGWAALRLLPPAVASALVLTAWCWWATPTPRDLWSTAPGTAEDGDLVAWVLDLEADAATQDDEGAEAPTP